MLNPKYFISIYLVLLLVCVGLMVLSTFRPDPTIAKTASDAFKTVIGAAIGALSTLLARTEKKENEE